MSQDAVNPPAAHQAAQDLPSQPPAAPEHQHEGFWTMLLGSMGVVYGDIGTSPLYALKAALDHMKADGVVESEVIGIVSLLIWALFFTVTLKYVFFLMRADNKGEGGTLSLMALAQNALGRRSRADFPARRRRRRAVFRRRHHHPGHIRAFGGRGPEHRPPAPSSPMSCRSPW